MRPDDLKQWMAENDKRPIDIAAALHIDPNTVRRYLRGLPVHRSTRMKIQELVGYVKKSGPEERKPALVG
jgi:hypothetical protein